MTETEIVIMAFALALDAMIVAFGYGLIFKHNRLKTSLTLSFSFAFFQFLMPVLGWLLSCAVYSKISAYSKYIVCAVFMVLGVKFFIDAFNKEKLKIKECLSPLCIFLLSTATGIDALGAGISIKFSGISILHPALVTGIITFILSFAGFWTANVFCRLPAKYISVAGALCLIYLGLKSLL